MATKVSDDKAIFTSSATGVKLAVTQVPTRALMEALKKLVEPKPPTIQIEGRRQPEENPNDPEYQSKLAEYRHQQMVISENLYLAVGTSLSIPVPDGVYQPEDVGWSEPLELAGIEIPAPGGDLRQTRERYVSWLRLYALGDQDIDDLLTKIFVASGRITEEQVKQAVESFRDQTTRPDNNGSVSAPEG